MRRIIERAAPHNIDLVLEYVQKPAAHPALIGPLASLPDQPLAAQRDALPKRAAPDQLAARLHARVALELWPRPLP